MGFKDTPNHDVAKAQEHVQKAIALTSDAPQPHIWDLLAECHYLQKNYAGAVEAATNALDASTSEAAPEGDDKIRKRLERFEALQARADGAGE